MDGTEAALVLVPSRKCKHPTQEASQTSAHWGSYILFSPAATSRALRNHLHVFYDLYSGSYRQNIASGLAAVSNMCLQDRANTCCLARVASPSLTVTQPMDRPRPSHGASHHQATISLSGSGHRITADRADAGPDFAIYDMSRAAFCRCEASLSFLIVIGLHSSSRRSC